MSPEATFNLAQRLWVYQAERFPVIKHGLLIAAFSSCGICLSTLLRHDPHWPAPKTFVVGFVVLFGLFLHLRIVDEFKDADVDARYRPTRPVPRGLIRLNTLKWVAVATAAVQVVACLWLYLPLVLLLAMVWGYMALMSAEFFVPKWLKAQPVVYLLSHMLIMPLVDVWVSACDWLPATGHPPQGLGWFLALSYCNGIVLEIGRKTWAPTMERPGVDTYSALWGLRSALGVWAAALLAAIGFAAALSRLTGALPVIAVASAAAAGLAGWLVVRLWRRPSEGLAKALDALSGVWVLICYLGLGAVSLGMALWAR
jgi:4-hydroxybenzoate polyprenyltransferase